MCEWQLLALGLRVAVLVEHTSTLPLLHQLILDLEITLLSLLTFILGNPAWVALRRCAQSVAAVGLYNAKSHIHEHNRQESSRPYPEERGLSCSYRRHRT